MTLEALIALEPRLDDFARAATQAAEWLVRLAGVVPDLRRVHSPCRPACPLPAAGDVGGFRRGS